MALRLFCSDTLNDNWAEERLKPLRGVLADFGYREYKSTYRTSFCPLSPGDVKRHQREAKTELPSVTQAYAVQETLCLRPLKDPHSQSCHDQPQQSGAPPNGSLPNQEPETTFRAAFGVPKRRCKTVERVLYTPDAPACGRVEGEMVQRTSGMRPMRPVGERVKEDEDPMHSTSAQRSWMRAPDAVLKYHNQGGVPIAPPAKHLSLPLGEGRVTRANFRRKRSITREWEPNTQMGTSVWTDFHIAPGEA